MEPTSSVRRLKVAHGRVWRWRQQQWEAVQGPHDTLWTWQQHEEAVQGPMTDYGPGSSMRSRPYTAPYHKNGTHQQCKET
ncbi:unnamed protein product [Staurois parvus]|uniref:Uncharacterized protein n=1 Tax=Staurois parvus TaxID=386267 RepID=A0ABN9HTN5_9NEOB|nr:unnamed protein product [Staurois parvus]